MHSLNRREMIMGTLVVAGAAAAVAGCGDTSPSRRPSPGFVLVGGSAAPSFFWMPVVRELALRGASAYAVELPGHGLDADFPPAYQCPQDGPAFARAPTPTAGKTLDDYATIIVTAIQQMAAHGPVIVWATA
jgi:alpha-beta hydrolase superfamily lysophospholipase